MLPKTGHSVIEFVRITKIVVPTFEVPLKAVPPRAMVSRERVKKI